MTEYPPLFTAPPAGADVEATIAAVDVVRTYCGWHIAPSVTETVVVDGPGSHLLMVRSLHVTDVASVVDAGAWVFYTPILFGWSESGIIEAMWGRRWSRLRGGITVTFTHGYPVVPPAIQAVVAKLAKAGIEGKPGSVSVGQISVTNTAESQAGVAGLDAAAIAILNRYRILG